MMLAYQRSPLLFLLFCLPFLAACQKPAATQNGSISEAKTNAGQLPDWLNNQIQGFQKDKPANPPVKIYSYLYHFQEVYYITGRCCDIPSAVYDATGKQLCQPDGGITGRGDGKCADFFESRTDEKLIWEDARK